MSKRLSVSRLYGQQKISKFEEATTTQGSTAKELVLTNIPSDTESSLLYLKSLFPTDKFQGALPPVIVERQVYSIVKNKTVVDKELNRLQQEGKIRRFRLGGELSELVAIFADDFKEQIKHCCSLDKPPIKRFLNIIVSEVQGFNIDKNVLLKRYFTETDIREIVNAGLLTRRTPTSYCFSFPNIGEFTRSFVKGHKSLLRSIKQSKFSEVLQQDLEQRKMEKSVKLGIKYHIHDLIGADLVTCIETTSGKLLRLEK